MSSVLIRLLFIIEHLLSRLSSLRPIRMTKAASNARDSARARDILIGM